MCVTIYADKANDYDDGVGVDNGTTIHHRHFDDTLQEYYYYYYTNTRILNCYYYYYRNCCFRNYWNLVLAILSMFMR